MQSVLSFGLAAGHCSSFTRLSRYRHSTDLINSVVSWFFKKSKVILKGVGMPWPKKFFFEFIVGLDRVAQDKLFGVGMTLLRPRVCPLETV